MLLHAGRLDAQLLDAVIHNLVDLRVIQHNAVPQVLVINADADIVLDGEASEYTISAAVLSNHTDTGIHGILRALDGNFLSVNLDLSGGKMTDSEDTLHGLCSLGADQSAKAENLALMDIEGYILERLFVDGA